MLIQGISNKQRINSLFERYKGLVSNGINPEDILVIFLNSYKKADFVNELKKTNFELSDKNILTFWGLCYNTFKDNWGYISKLNGIDRNAAAPNLCGLEVSQYIFKKSIKTADFSDYISKVNLLHQLFRRYSLTVQNVLSPKEVKERSLLLNETFYKDAQNAIEDYKIKTIEYNSFDYLRQLAVLPLIYKNTDYFSHIKYLIVDDADEYSYAFWCFVNAIMPNLEDYYIAYDKDGSSRCGYLCAYKSGISEFKKKYNPKETVLESKAKFFNEAQILFETVKNGKKCKLTDISYNTFSKRLNMFDAVLKKISVLLKSGTKPKEIAVITPVIDEVLLQSFLNSNYNINFQILSGNEKLNSQNCIKHILTLLKLFNNVKILNYELKSLLINLLKIPYKKCSDIINTYSKENNLPDITFNKKSYDYAYKKLLSLIKSEKQAHNNISEQIDIIYTNILKEFETDINITKYDFLYKEAKNFEEAFKDTGNNLAQDFITQIENSIISENPADSFAIKQNSVIISSPQKIVDYSISTKYQLWLDISDGEWVKNDTGTLYNAWVLNRDWNKKEFTIQDNIELTEDKTARLVRKVMLCAEKEISFYGSIYDNTGNETFGGLSDFIEIKDNNKIEFNIIPRNDQKPVLEYSKNKMGIMAVPGAGKTTILLALIIKLIKQGIKPENIFVLTYMESAAKNFKEKIQLAIPNSSELPNISTIHGLALRIIKENGNYILAGLDDKFEICDDTTKEKIIKELFFKLKIDDDKYENYLRCISIVKLSENNKDLHSKFKEIQDFYNFYNEYNTVLKSNNLIDYDDMLYYAVNILENNKEVLNYYQNICEYVIEDEAQDSTDIQQRLINLISGKYNNVVRCGDINQAITSTFTNSNPENFKRFIDTGKKVEMVSSQRCAKPVYNLANLLVKTAGENEEQKNAFYKIEMKGTDNNPKSDKNPEYLLFDDEKEEKKFVLNKVSELIKDNPSCSIAILLRLNSQVTDYNELFMNNGIKTSVRTDCLSQKSIYRIIINILNLIREPNNNKYIYELAKEYKQAGIHDFNEDALNYISSLKEPFIKQNIDDINEESLLQLYWDIDYWLNNSAQSTDILVLNICLYYAKDTTEKSNAYMISTMVRRLTETGDNLEEIIKKLDYAAQKPMSAYKFFEEDTSDSEIKPVCIMTMHKAKGDEFDYVFIPELNEENYSTEIKNAKLKSGNHFVQTIRNLAENTGIKQPEELKREQIYENLRLLYVGITRAKMVLYMSNAKNYKRRKNTKPVNLIQKLAL